MKGSHMKLSGNHQWKGKSAKYDGKTGKPRSEETKRKIGLKNAINSLGNTNAKGHRLSESKRKEISIKTKLGMKKKLLE